MRGRRGGTRDEVSGVEGGGRAHLARVCDQSHRLVRVAVQRQLDDPDHALRRRVHQVPVRRVGGRGVGPRRRRSVGRTRVGEQGHLGDGTSVGGA